MTTKIRRIGNETEDDRMLNQLFVSPIRTSFLEVGEDKYVLPVYYEGLWEQVENLEVRDDDVWVTGHPKTGTSWLFEIVRFINNDLDFESHLDFLTSFLDYSIIHDANKIETDFGVSGDSIQKLNELKSPRCIKTHLLWSLLPQQIKDGTKKPKIIHIFRNPKDTCVSYYHNSQLMDGYVGNFNQFCQLFISGRMNYGPFFATPLSYWRERQRPNLLLVHYKDLKRDAAGSIKTIAEFMGKSFTEDQIKSLVERTSFKTMQKVDDTINKEARQGFFKFYNLTKADNKFVRVGKEGGYKAVMAPELIEKFDEWTKENLNHTGLNLE